MEWQAGHLENCSSVMDLGAPVAERGGWAVPAKETEAGAQQPEPRAEIHQRACHEGPSMVLTGKFAPICICRKGHAEWSNRDTQQ